tara:strand:- start:380 stop:1009 length:630 start_codon:yes stop_codon:yes gene_type:complete
MSYLDLETFKPFGPSIAKVTIPKNIVDQLNEHTEQIIKDSEKSKDLNFGNNLVGNVQQEFKLEKEFMNKIGWGEFLANGVKSWIEKSNKKTITKFNITNSWIVRQFENEYNPAHFHTGHVSGVGYLKVPEDLGKPIQENKENNYNGKLELIHGSKMFLCDPQFRVKPKVGDFYFFPHYLLHTVYPFADTKEERRSVSFNATVNHEVFNS